MTTIFPEKTRDNPDGLHRLPGSCLYCGVDAADTIETGDGILLRCPKCKFSSGPHVTYGIAVRGWRRGLPSQAPTILLWVAEESDAMRKRALSRLGFWR
jgi:hypothetical protein